MAQQLIHKHSNVNMGSPKAPNAGVLQKGEIAVNYNSTDPCLFIEKEDGSIAKFSAAGAIQDYVDSTIASETARTESTYLKEHQPLKTINEQSLVGTGNITAGGVGESFGTNMGEIFNAYTGTTRNIANAQYSHAEGYDNQVSGKYGHVEGLENVCAAEGGHTEGKWCMQGDLVNWIHIVGVGTQYQPRNGHIITTSGLHYIPGVGGYMGTENVLSGVKDLATVINEKQDLLVSGENIKTINGQSLVGNGNIIISGGGTGGGVIYLGISGVTTDNVNATVGLTPQVIGSSTITSLTNIPITNRLLLANVSTSQSVSYAALPQNGYEVHIIIHNTGSNVINITLPNSGNYICTSPNVIYIAGGLYGEVNLAVIGGKGYIRGVSSI